MTVIGPGDRDDVRLVMKSSWEKSSVMKLESGQATPVYYLDVVSRSLASVTELEGRSLGFSEEQARQHYQELGELLGY